MNDGHVAEDGVLDHDGDPGCVEDGEVQGASVRQQGLGFRGWVVTKTTFPNVWGPLQKVRIGGLSHLLLEGQHTNSIWRSLQQKP